MSKKRINVACSDCPFRDRNYRTVTYARAGEIADSLRQGGMFPCHKTVDYSGDSGEGEVTDKSRWCAGAIDAMDKDFGAEQNQMARISERLGFLRMDDIVPQDDVPSLEEWEHDDRRS